VFWVFYPITVVVFVILHAIWQWEFKSLILIITLVAAYLALEIWACVREGKPWQGKWNTILLWWLAVGCIIAATVFWALSQTGGRCATRTPSSSRTACSGTPWPGPWRCCSTSTGERRTGLTERLAAGRGCFDKAGAGVFLRVDALALRGETPDGALRPIPAGDCRGSKADRLTGFECSALRSNDIVVQPLRLFLVFFDKVKASGKSVSSGDLYK
jgi:hypothetical protein